MNTKKGNPVILKMIVDGSFDSDLADDLLSGTNLDDLIYNENGYTTTYLNEAVMSANLPAVRYLFEHGADPNYCNDEECVWPLSELQTNYSNNDVSDQYEIEKLFFKYGADPNLLIEGLETVYDSVVFQVYNDSPSNAADRENLRQFYKLLVLYGGGNSPSGYGKPSLEGVDISKMDDYRVQLYQCEDGYHIMGFLVDKEGNKIAEL